MAAGQYERSGTRASAHPNPELRIKFSYSVPNPRAEPFHSITTNPISQNSHCAVCPLHTRSVPAPDRTKYVAHTHLVSLAGTSKRQSSFQTLRMKCAIQTLQIRQHRSARERHLVLTSKLLSLEMQHDKNNQFE